MRVLFANPPWWEGSSEYTLPGGKIKQLWTRGVRAGSRWPHTNIVRSGPDDFVFGDISPYPFFLGWAASYVAAKLNVETVLRDSIALCESYDSFFTFMERQRFDYMVFETASPAWEHDCRLINQIKARWPDMKIILCGPIASMAQRVWAEAPVAALITAEYEKTVTKVIEQGLEGDIAPELLTLEEMNGAPFQYMDALHAYRYWDENPRGQLPPQLQIMSSRGCPYKCIFCVWPAVMTGNDPDGNGKRSVRQYSRDYLDGLITEMFGRFKFNSIYFDDDTFNLGDRHVDNVCEVLADKKVPWSAMCRADTISIDRWRKMRDAGCIGVKIGFESGSQFVIDNIVNKRLDLEKARHVVAEIKKLGMAVHGTFTYGLPGETAEQMLETKRYINSLGLTSYQESGTAEIEGTPLANLRDGDLKRYAAAARDEDYIAHQDGKKKFSILVGDQRGE